MIRLQAFTLALLALVACTSTRSTQVIATPAVTSPAVAVSDASAPATDAALVATDAASGDVTTDDASSAQAPPDPHLLRLRALAADDAALRAGIDPARGVTMIRYIEAPPSGEGREVHTSQRLCGAALTRSLPAVRRAINAALEQTNANDAFDCQGDVCTVPGMEYQPVYRLYFVSAGDTLKLEAIAQVSEAAMNSEWLLRATDYVTSHLDAARARPCAQTSR